MFEKIFKLIDSRPVVIFFALWTGFYLVQAWRRQGAVNEMPWIGAGLVAALLLHK